MTGGQRIDCVSPQKGISLLRVTSMASETAAEQRAPAQSPGHFSRDQAHTSSAAAHHIYTREAKGQPVPKPAVRITSAFGLRECPKVVELLADEDLAVRQQALLVLCDVFGRPDKVVMALRLLVVKVPG